MSDQGEKTCPLCMEEMDLTDQQLKPCKCGYEICVWCWHQIMDLAEKEDTEGRCPACRTPYDKEKIVGMASNCERLVTEINSERRSKSHKTKPKTAEGRKHLSSVRVIQRNLVYIIGIPSNLADEDLLQHKEYFGQYGKVQKVSIARTAGGAIQHSANNTCSVYITYSNEDEAVRCIQSVHGYTLEGKPLRACFGTTKYCHAWLRNMPCSNPDCLYLHDIGSGEDSFTKDEIISEYTRNRVQQNTSAMNNLQRRAGSTLPPPADEFCISSSATSDKPIIKNVPNNSSVHVKGSPPNGSSGRSIALPAAASWGLRVSNSRTPVSSSPSLGGPTKQKSDSSSSSFPAVNTSAMQGSTLHVDTGKKSTENEESLLHHHSREGLLEPSNEHISSDQATTSESHAEVVRVSTPGPISSSNHSTFSPTSKVREGGLTISPNFKHSIELDKPTSKCASVTHVTASEKSHGLGTGLSSPSIDEHLTVRNFSTSSNGSVSTLPLLRTTGNHDLQQYYPEDTRDSLTTIQPRNTGVESAGVSVLRESFDWRSESAAPVLPTAHIEEEMDSLALDCQGLKLSENLISDTSNYRNACRSGGPVSKNLNTEANESFSQFLFNDSVLPNGSVADNLSGSYVEKGQYLGSFNDVKVEKTTADMGESSIISNILSMDSDVWDDSLTSPINLVKLLSDHDKHHSSLKLQSSLKAQKSNQSRFSFARQEDYVNQGYDMRDSLNNFDRMATEYTHQDSLVNRDPYFEKLRNGFSSTMFAESDIYSNIQSIAPPTASKSQIQPPPGFSLPNRAPPPGFSSQERMDQAFELFPGNHLHDSYFSRNQYAGHTSAGYGSAADVELLDPAILAVGKGRLPNGTSNSGFDMRSSFPSQFSTPEDLRLQMLMQQQISGHQNLRFPDHIGDRYSSLGDAYRVQSRYSEQPQASNPSSFGQYSLHQSQNAHMLNGHWDGWNELQTGNDLAMAELLRNERMGLNKHFTGYEDLKYRMPTSGDIYSRAFGM